MSKKNNKKRRQQRKVFPWPLVGLGVVLLIAAGFFLLNPGGGGGGKPSIAVDQQQIDYGDQHFGTNLTFEIKVTNTGSGTLRFKEKPYIEVLKGC